MRSRKRIDHFDSAEELRAVLVRDLVAARGAGVVSTAEARTFDLRVHLLALTTGTTFERALAEIEEAADGQLASERRLPG